LSTVRIVVADDHAVVRSGIANAVRELANIEIVGEANDGDTLLSILDRTRPDMLVTDVTMPGKVLGTELADEAALRGIPALIVTGNEGPMVQLEQTGQRYLRKPFRLNNFLKAVRERLCAA